MQGAPQVKEKRYSIGGSDFVTGTFDLLLSALQFAFGEAGFRRQVKEAEHPAPPPAFYLEWHYAVS